MKETAPHACCVRAPSLLGHSAVPRLDSCVEHQPPLAWSPEWST
jgi:hypothetical protein